MIKPTERYITVGDSLCVQPASSFIDASVRDRLDVDLNASQETDHSSHPKYKPTFVNFRAICSSKEIGGRLFLYRNIDTSPIVKIYRVRVVVLYLLINARV